MLECWRDIPSWEGLYQASNTGRIRSLDRPRSRGRVLAPVLLPNGYLYVSLSRKPKKIQRSVASLVLTAFVGPRPKGQLSLHGDGVRTNNALKNLRWGTYSTNIADARKHGTLARGERQGASKLCAMDVAEIRASKLTGVFLSRQFGVSTTTICHIRKRRSWRHV